MGVQNIAHKWPVNCDEITRHIICFSSEQALVFQMLLHVIEVRKAS